MSTSSFASSVLPFPTNTTSSFTSSARNNPAPASNSSPSLSNPGPANSSTASSADTQDAEAQPSFADILHQQDGGNTTASPAKTGSASTPAAKPGAQTAAAAAASLKQDAQAATAATTTTTLTAATITSALVTALAAKSKVSATATPATTGTASQNPKAGAKANVLAPSSDLASLIVQATVLASSVKQPAATTPAKAPVSTTTTDSRKNASKDTTAANSNELDLTALIAQATLAASNVAVNSAATTIQAAPAPTAATTASSALAGDLAQIAQTTLSTGSKLSLPPSTPATTGTPAKEKKSVSTNAEGSFLQQADSASSTTSSPLDTLTSLLSGGSNSTGVQQLTTGPQTKKSPVDNLSIGNSIAAGTANVEKKTVMNTNLDPSQILPAATGASAALQQTNADVHIKLSSNSDFEDALAQVMHVAQLSQASEARTPMRIAMELQTPPGAIVNVYVSKQDDGYRAQLSTNDAQALSWVQDKMSSLSQSNELGVQVRWLPPQMESGTAPSTSSNNDSNLAWDRGGQGQQGQQQPDERSQSARQQEDDFFGSLAGTGTNSFMTTLTSIGSAA